VLAAGLGQVGQHPVTHGVAVHVVDLLEAVHVDHQREGALRHQSTGPCRVSALAGSVV
jgi:hypothetical protein